MLSDKMDTPKKLGRPRAASIDDDVASLGFDADESFTTEEEAMSAAAALDGLTQTSTLSEEGEEY